MRECGLASKFAAVILIIALQGGVVSASADTATADLTGTVFAKKDQAPLSGVQVFAADRETGKIFPSEATTDDGRFALSSLPVGTYEVAVGAEQALYLVGRPVVLNAGKNQRVSIAVEAEVPGSEPAPEGSARPSLWNNPLTASFVVLGAAVVVGVLVEEATDDDDVASPFF